MIFISCQLTTSDLNNNQTENKNEIYVTVCQDKVLGGLNSGSFLITTPPNEIAEHVMNMLYSYLRSNQTVTLNDTFKINIKVLSVEHMKHKEKKKIEKQQNRVLVGLYDKATDNRKRQWCFTIPHGFPSNDSCFANRCIIVALTLGFYLMKSRQETDNSKTFKKDYAVMSQVNSKNKSKAKSAGILLWKNTTKLCSEAHLSTNGPFELEDTIKKFSDTLMVQVHIFRNVVGNSLCYSYPTSFDSSLPQIYLHQSEPANQQNETISHVDLITKITTYFNDQGLTCFSCRKFFRAKRYRHLCKYAKLISVE